MRWFRKKTPCERGDHEWQFYSDYDRELFIERRMWGNATGPLMDCANCDARSRIENGMIGRYIVTGNEPTKEKP